LTGDSFEAGREPVGLFNRKNDKSSPVIDLREPDPSRPRWGAPVPCPKCRGRGYLDHIDPYREVMFIHCTACFAKYEVARADIEAGASSKAVTR
jgi:hypothetical protein